MKWESYWTIISLRRNNAYDPKPGYAPHRTWGRTPVDILTPLHENEHTPWSRYAKLMLARRKVSIRVGTFSLSAKFKKGFR